MAVQGVQFIPITPKRPITNFSVQAVKIVMTQLKLAGINKLAKYPPAVMPSQSARTGRLGQGWTGKGPRMVGLDLTVDIGNKMSYSKHVQGFKYKEPLQRQPWINYGWLSSETGGNDVWAEYEPRLIKVLEGDLF